MKKGIMLRFVNLIFPALLLLTACGTSNNLATTYTMIFRNFTTKEVFRITDKMENFSGFVRWRDPEGGSAVSRHGYVTKTSGSELYRNIYDTLTEMGLNPDGQVSIIKRGKVYNLDKIF